jgi:hypothetical protein
MDLTHVCRVFYPEAEQYIFLSAAYKAFSKIDYILGHKASLNKYKKIEITPCILSAVKLGLNNKRSSRKYSNNWRLNNTLFHGQWVIKEIRKSETFLFPPLLNLKFKI